MAIAVLFLAACGGGSDETLATAAATPASPAAAAAASTPAAVTAAVPLIVSARVTDEALATLVRTDGTVDAVLLKQAAQQIGALRGPEQVAVLDDLAMRVEIAAAKVSGLESLAGGQAATTSALRGAWLKIAQQYAAAAVLVPLKTSPASAARVLADSPSAATVGTFGVVLGASLLSASAGVVVGNTNDLKAGGQQSIGGTPVLKGAATVEQASVDIEVKGTQEGVDVTLKSSAQFHPCPGPDGKFDITAKLALSASKGGEGQNSTIDLAITGVVDDNASLASSNVESHVQWADFGGGRAQFLDFSTSGPEGYDNFKLNRLGSKSTKDFVSLAVVIGLSTAAKLAGELKTAAEAAWKSGRCVKLEPTAAPGPSGLAPSAKSTITAAPRSKVDGLPTGGGVTASLSAGGASVSPSGTRVPADASFAYVAPDQPDQSGTVNVESRSRRGVGKGSITLDTKRPTAFQIVGGLDDFQTNQAVCDVTKPFTLTGGGFTVQFSGGFSGTYTHTGPFNSMGGGTYTISLPDGTGAAASMTGNGTGSVTTPLGTFTRSGTEHYTLTPLPACQ